jgi:hypothetical protein
MGGDGSFSLGYARSLKCKNQAGFSPPLRVVRCSVRIGWHSVERASRPALDQLILQTKCATMICHNKSKMTVNKDCGVQSGCCRDEQFCGGVTVAITAKAARHRDGISRLHDCLALGIFRPTPDVWRIPLVHSNAHKVIAVFFSKSRSGGDVEVQLPS